jgi:transcriptional regulator with XRE-family HTH domain
MSEPNFVDVHVGSRLRLRRVLVNMSQEALGDAVGVSFQQVQKYESGANRISASRLFQLAGELGVEVSYFFEGLSLPSPQAAQKSIDDAKVTSLLSSKDGIELASAWSDIGEPTVRRQMLELMRALASPGSLKG